MKNNHLLLFTIHINFTTLKSHMCARDIIRTATNRILLSLHRILKLHNNLASQLFQLLISNSFITERRKL